MSSLVTNKHHIYYWSLYRLQKTYKKLDKNIDHMSCFILNIYKNLQFVKFAPGKITYYTGHVLMKFLKNVVMLPVLAYS